jgi:anhydro-N-acetylmuramic acid kinase
MPSEAPSLIERYRRRPRRTVAGVMSGTSLDGIDVALCALSGTGRAIEQRLLGFECMPFDRELRERLLAASAGSLPLRATFELEADLGVAYAAAIAATLQRHDVAVESLDAIGLHGQTVYHAPSHAPLGVSVQLSGGAIVADRLGAIVVDDFRAADVAAGGQGAPLVPYCDLVLLASTERNRIALNIGGIANLTWLPRDARAEHLVAFDTGPGNMLVDAAMRTLFGRELDAGGAVAAAGTIDREWLEDILGAERYFALPAPKSTGRELFGEERARALVDSGAARGLDDASIVATLTALTAETVARAAVSAAAAERIDEVIVGGGGARNATLMRMLSDVMPSTRVVSGDEVGVPADAKEAICFAILANEALCETPANVPSVTGARSHVICGAVRLPPVPARRR